MRRGRRRCRSCRQCRSRPTTRPRRPRWLWASSCSPTRGCRAAARWPARAATTGNSGWTDAQVLSRKDDGNLNTRHTPTLYNVGYQTAWYWDGRATTLEGQILAAWRAQIGADPAKATAVINAVPGYRSQFMAVWGAEATPDTIVKSLGAFFRTLRQHRLALGPPRGRRQQRGVQGRDRGPGAVRRQGPLRHLPRAAVLRQQHLLQHRAGTRQGQARPGPLQRHQERGRPRRLQDADAALGGDLQARTSTMAARPR